MESLQPSPSLALETDPLFVEEVQTRAAKRRSSGVKLTISLFVDSAPVIISYILQNSIQTSAVLIAGRLGPDELSAAAFSYMLAFVSGWCVALGGTTALDTLGSQAFTGSSLPSEVSIHFQRCVLVLWCLLCPVCLLWAFIEPVLLFLGQSRQLSGDVQRFLRVLIFGAPGYVAFESLKKYLQCQGIMRASTVALLVVSPINLILNVFFVHHTRWGLYGSPLAVSITYWIALFVLILLTIISPAHKKNKTWAGIRIREALEWSRVLGFLRLALPGILMVGTEWAAFEVVALAAGRLGPLSLSAQSAIMTTDQIVNTVPFGIGVAASARVGNLIGARNARGAEQVGHLAALLSVVVGSIIMAVMIAAKDIFGYLFTDDEDTVRLVAKVMPLVASFQVADGLAGSCGGVLRGQGALFNFVAYYIIALPLGIALAFLPQIRLGLRGLWIGQVVALFIVGVGEYGVVWLGTDWEREVMNGFERIQPNSNPAEQPDS